MRAWVLTTVAALACLPRLARGDEITIKAESPWQASSTIGKRDLEERLPRSAPDALRFEPGVYVQQTAHGQASPFVRGRTGQQTLLLFDGIRLNNATFRQGPNQYLFTVDARTVQSIEVLRGGSSTLWGTDALGGVVHAHPLEPTFDPERGFYVRPRSMLRFGTADGEFGHRFQLDAQIGKDLLFLGGVGFRRIGRLRSGGAVVSPTSGLEPQVPAFEDDGKTMLGTGFKELTTDARVAYRVFDDARIVGAAYLYRQYDSPRTDQCPPPFAPRRECLIYEEQFRTLTYVAYEGALGKVFPDARFTLSYQRQHERRRHDRPSANAELGGRDDVDSFGLTAKMLSAELPLAKTVLGFGGDVYLDTLRSIAWTRFTDIGVLVPAARGQYISGSSYVTSGVYAHAAATPLDALGVRFGGRVGATRAHSPEEPVSSTRGVDRTWATWSSFAQLEARLLPRVSAIVAWDRSFRAPNLDDLTSRQQVGPGFQFENAGLVPETAHTFEAGLRAKLGWLLAEGWVFRSIVHDAITRAIRSAGDCPPNTPGCGESWNRFQLVNASGASIIDGIELSSRVRVGEAWLFRGTFAYAIGRGPNPQQAPSDPRVPYEREVPLSRVAPMNGTFEARFSPFASAYVGAALRWAAAQTRLAPSDRSDARIPEGGTPAFAVFDLRAGYRVERNFLVTLVVENVGDAPYRYHGSSINGPGRSVLLAVEAGL